MARIAIFGGSFNPPGIHHVRIVEELRQYFDEVVIVPCGPRPDKPTVNDVDPVHRAAMVDLTFRDMPGITVDLTDLELDTFTRTYDLDHEFRAQGEVWHVVGTDLIVGGRDSCSQIHDWHRGAELWQEGRFAVIARSGFETDPRDMPRNSRLFTPEHSGSSSEIRRRAFEHQPVEGLVVPHVVHYLERHGLYRGIIPSKRAPKLELRNPRISLIVDQSNDRAVAAAERLEALADDENPDLIVVMGGDGTMLHAIRKHWRRRVPFFGINFGHRGFLLNNVRNELSPVLFTSELMVRHAPLLFIETEDTTGRRETHLAFNEGWVERAGGLAAWIEVRVDDQVRLPKLVADGALLGTASGSTAYARAMGATPLPVGAPAIVLVGSNVFEPMGWRSVHLPLDVEVEFRALDPVRRPLEGFVDGVSCGQIVRMRLRRSRIAAAELAFLPEHDLSEKLASLQFPK